MDLLLAYKQAGDYRIPDVVLGDSPDRPLGRYGLMRKEFLRQHRPVLWVRLCTSGGLFRHCLEIEDEASRRMEAILPALTQSAGATEELKERDSLQWAGLMNTCQAQAEEIVLRELVYC